MVQIAVVQNNHATCQWERIDVLEHKQPMNTCHPHVRVPHRDHRTLGCKVEDLLCEGTFNNSAIHKGVGCCDVAKSTEGSPSHKELVCISYHLQVGPRSMQEADSPGVPLREYPYSLLRVRSFFLVSSIQRKCSHLKSARIWRANNSCAASRRSFALEVICTQLTMTTRCTLRHTFL